MLSSLPCRMALAIGCVFHSTSRARCRFAPRSSPGSSRWATTARRLSASWYAHVALHVLRKQVGEAADRPLGVAGVQRGEDEVARLGGAQGHLGRLAVADLADEDHVGVLPQPVLQPVGEGQHVGADLALRARPSAAACGNRYSTGSSTVMMR